MNWPAIAGIFSIRAIGRSRRRLAMSQLPESGRDPKVSGPVSAPEPTAKIKDPTWCYECSAYYERATGSVVNCPACILEKRAKAMRDSVQIAARMKAAQAEINKLAGEGVE